MEDVELDNVEIKAYEKIISTRKVKQLERNDKIIWMASNDGKYSVKNGYKALINSKRWEEVEIPLKLYWDLASFPKESFFLMASISKQDSNER